MNDIVILIPFGENGKTFILIFLKIVKYFCRRPAKIARPSQILTHTPSPFAPAPSIPRRGFQKERAPPGALSLWRTGWDSPPAGGPGRGSDVPPARHSLPRPSNPTLWFSKRKEPLPGLFPFGGQGGIRPPLRRRPPRVARRHRRLAKRPRVRIPIPKQKTGQMAGFLFWRTGWDSNPRYHCWYT